MTTTSDEIMTTEIGDDFEVNANSVPANYEDRFQILAMGGGGYRGLFSILMLEKLESTFDSVSDRFDMFAGTSIGAILAGAIALGIPATTCRKKMVKRGKEIFPPGGLVRSPIRLFRKILVRAPYSTEPLESVIRDILGDDAERLMSEIDVPLLIPAVSHTDATTVVYKSAGLNRNDASDVTLIDAMLASAAAPTYFRPRFVDNRVLIDGGLVANSPDIIAITEALGSMSKKLDKVHLLSVGTASESLARATQRITGSSAAGWIFGRKLFQVSMAAQSDLVDRQAKILLGNRYVRLDKVPNAEQGKVIGLATATKPAVDTLTTLADGCWDEMSVETNPTLRRMFRKRNVSSKNVAISKSSSVAKAIRLSFDQLREHYPTQSRADLFRSLGGQWPDLVKDTKNYGNTCAVRLSVAHYRAGRSIPAKYKEAIDGDGNAIILKVSTFKKFAIEAYGSSDWGMSKPEGSDVSADHLPKVPGIIVYHVDWKNATGHFDLWTGEQFIGTGDFDDIKQGFSLAMWFLN